MRSLHDDEIDRLRLAVAATGAGIWDYDIDADQLYCDDRWHEILGLDPDRPVRSIEEFKPHIHPEDRERATEVRAPFAELTANGEDYRIIYRIIRADGVSDRGGADQCQSRRRGDCRCDRASNRGGGTRGKRAIVQDAGGYGAADRVQFAT